MPQAFIMAGGQGERFWPLTKKNFPKYRIRLDGKRSLLQQTFRRLEQLYEAENVHVVTTKEHYHLIREELPQLGKDRILMEPFRSNTAPAILYSTVYAEKNFGPDEVVSFFPADHLIKNEVLFRRTMLSAFKAARETPMLMTIGIKPTFPCVGYGYIQAGRALGGSGAFRVDAFKEKPDRATAMRYLRRKVFLWNGGIFTWRAGVFMQAMKRYNRAMVQAFDLDRLEESYKKMPRISIDYALLEKADNIAVLKTRMDWCDMGSWDMFFDKAERNGDNNLIFGKGSFKECRDSLILNATDEPLIAMGASGLIIVKTSQGVLVCLRSRSEEAALLARNA